MPTIAETANQLAQDDLAVLFLDTCILLDVIRAPLRKPPGCIQSAVELAEMQAQSRCRMVASSLIQREWDSHEKSVVAELDQFLKLRDQDALAFHEACGLVKVPLSFGKASYQAAGLATRLRDLSGDLLSKSIHLLPSDQTNLKAHSRQVAYLPPARKGGGPEDCVIIEEYLELSRQLHALGFAKKKTFCSSNTNDYQDGRKLHQHLTTEFDAVGLVFTCALPWAVHELKQV